MIHGSLHALVASRDIVVASGGIPDNSVLTRAPR
jgi:hypothetical protein